MKKISTFLVSFLFICFFTVGKVNAVTLSPNTGTVISTTETSINILASSAAHTTAQVNLTFTNLTVTAFTAGSGMTSIGSCSGSANFTATSVCSAISKGSANFTAGEVLATIKVKANTAGTGTIAVGAGSEYTDGTAANNLAISAGTIATYTTSSTQQTAGGTLPNTAFFDDFENKNLFIASTLGFLAVLVLTINIYDKFFFARFFDRLFFKKLNHKHNWREEDID